jgi:hypothetical protein
VWGDEVTRVKVGVIHSIVTGEGSTAPSEGKYRIDLKLASSK